VAELEKLVDTLSFSKERLQGKVAEFQEKYEFNRISNSRAPQGPWNPEQTPKMLTSAAAETHPSGPNSASWRWTATTISTFCRGRWRKFQLTLTRCFRNWKGSSGASKAISTSSQSWRTTCKMRLPPREWFRLARSIRDCRGPFAMPRTRLQARRDGSFRE